MQKSKLKTIINLYNNNNKFYIMKKIILTLIAISITLCNMAQEHLSFKGIPIEGSMTSFCQKLKAKGFTQIGRDNNVTLFIGDFTGKKSTVGVVAGDDGKNVFGVTVIFDASKEWNTLINTYNYYKDLYSRKYGVPSITKETNPALIDSNTAKMAEVYQGTVTWGSAWNIIGGSIDLSIEKSNGIYEGMVIIRYRDSQNVEAKIKSDMEDI